MPHTKRAMWAGETTCGSLIAVIPDSTGFSLMDLWLRFTKKSGAIYILAAEQISSTTLFVLF